MLCFNKERSLLLRTYHIPFEMVGLNVVMLNLVPRCVGSTGAARHAAMAPKITVTYSIISVTVMRG